MGDYRFSFKAKLSMGDVEEEKDMWLNYSPGETNIDRRVEEWLDDVFRRGKDSIDNAIFEAREEARTRERKEAEDEILRQADEIRKRRQRGET